MQSFIIQPTYKFGDIVRFDSRAQGFSGRGKIVAITIDVQGNIDYMLDIGKQLLQPGIYEDEIRQLEANADEGRISPSIPSKYNLKIPSKSSLGDRVRFRVPATLGSPGREGAGSIFAITLFSDDQIEYIIAIPRGEYDDLEAGILEEQITLETESKE